jgi:phospholipid/cholesterol/gamma-HCH transport system substrate-binding protein
METRARYALIGVLTLGVIIAAFAFAYWLRSLGGFSERAVYRIRFESPVIGLLRGSRVLFNGIPVGEVTGLALNPGDPHQVMVTIAVDRSVPIRADTQVRLDTQGLMDAPSVSLEGGTASAPPPSSDNGPPVLKAGPDAAQTLTREARDALRRLDSLVAENAEPLHETITNLSTFSDALARNSDRLDGILEALERLGGGGPTQKPGPIYDLTAPQALPAHDKVPSKQLVVPEPTAVVLFDTQKLLMSPRAGETIAMDAQWSDSLPKLLQAKIIQSLEDAGFLQAVVRPGLDIAADYQLLLDIRSFQLVLSPEPQADVAFAAKLVDGNGRIVGGRILHASAPVQGTDAPAAAAGLNGAFGKAVTELVLWVSDFI